MTKKIPDYLKLHREDLPAPAPDLAGVRGLSDVCRSFQEVTGWKLDYRADDTGASDRWGPSDDSTGPSMGKPVLTRSESPEDAASYDSIQPLAQAIGSMVEEIHRTRHAVWQREAELAAGIPVTIRADEQQHLARRLEGVLRGGAEAIGCQAAGLYLLDDATSHLKLRACWRLPTTRFLERPRLLRGSVADLEALVGHAVAIEDTSLLPHWKVPEDFPAALCVPVSTAATPLGTLWFFSDRVRDFSEEQTHLAEIIAGRLVSDLEREMLVAEGFDTRQVDQTLQGLADWQHEMRPSIPPLIDGWQVAGRGIQAGRVGGEFFDWCVLPDGRIAVAVGHAEGPSVNAALTAATVQVSLKSHAVHSHEPRQMVERLNETVWTHSIGNRFASLFYGVIDPDVGSFQYASAGQVHALLNGRTQCDSLTESRSPLGVDPDARFRQASRVLAARESLVIFNWCEKDVFDDEACYRAEKGVIGILESMCEATAEEQADAVFEKLTGGDTSDCTVVVVRHVG